MAQNKPRRRKSRSNGEPPPQPEGKQPEGKQPEGKQGRFFWILVPLLLALPAAFYVNQKTLGPTIEQAENGPTTDSSVTAPPQPKVRVFTSGKLSLVWEDLRKALPAAKAPSSDRSSNIHPADYAGPESCRECHAKNYEAWSTHPHRWMNALAREGTVKGDFSEEALISYRGGTASFFREGDEFRMRLERDGVVRLYQITQTIGSRFFQYYVGLGLSGPESPGHAFYSEDHLLPFGYWLDRNMWVPTVHVREELPDEQRIDPFDPPRDGLDGVDVVYAKQCNYCHTTFPLADMFMRDPNMMEKHAPGKMVLCLSTYLAESHPELWNGSVEAEIASDDVIRNAFAEVSRFEAPTHAATLGVSCEACHLGCKSHAERKLKKPEFLPSSPHFDIASAAGKLDMGRSHANINWACSRCHTGTRPSFAAGMGTWNSTEFADAMKGSCYSQLTCIQCHDPHSATGPKWSKSPEFGDQACLECHAKYAGVEARQRHTHHAPGTSGDHCLNCHMPKINEGLQDVVRTHMIFSPTRADMIEANHPNACNVCHVDKPIAWTTKYLKTWYGREYSVQKIAANYPAGDQPVARGWVRHANESVRLVGAAAVARENARWGVPDLIEQLDDEFLLNRQFAQIGLESMLGVDLNEFGYRFYMMHGERQPQLAKILEVLLPEK